MDVLSASVNDDKIAGMTGTAELTVGSSDTAVQFGSGHVDVLATPRVIALCEAAALDAKAAKLLEDLYKDLTPWRKCQVARHPGARHHVVHLRRRGRDVDGSAHSRR